MGYGFNASSHYPSFAFQSRSEWSSLLPCNHLPAQLIFSERSPERPPGSSPAQPGRGARAASGMPPAPGASCSAAPTAGTGRWGGRGEREKGKKKKTQVRVGEEINGSVQEEWWREIQKAVNSPFCTVRTWQEFHSLLTFQPSHVHSSETSHIWLPGWGVNFL